MSDSPTVDQPQQHGAANEAHAPAQVAPPDDAEGRQPQPSSPSEAAGETHAEAAEAQPAPQAPQPAPQAAAAAVDELEPQLKYERLGSDVKTILQDSGTAATCLCLSEKVLALGTSAGNVHILDYSGNEVKRFSLHAGRPVKHISFDDKAEYFATCCGDNYVSVSSLYTDETTKFTFKRPITVVALEGRYASRKTREFVTGDVRGRLKLSSQGWLGRSDHVIHQGEGTIRALSWHSSTLAWANEVGIKVYDTNMHQFVGSIKRPRGGRYADCFDCQLYVHDGSTAASATSGSTAGGGSTAAGEVLYVAWPDCIKVADVLTHIDPVSGAVSKALRVSASIPTDYFCMGVVPHGADLAVLVFVTDQDPDQDQVGLTTTTTTTAAAAAAAHGGTQQQQQGQQLTMQALPQQQPDASADTSTSAAAAGGTSVDHHHQQQQQQVAAAVDAASGPSTSGPINIPQPVRRPQRAANAYVSNSPSSGSQQRSNLLQQTTAAAADAAAGGGGGASGVNSSSSSPDVDQARRVLGGQSSTTTPAAAGGGGGGVVQRSLSGSSSSKGVGAGAGGSGGRPPLPNSTSSSTSNVYSRSSSVASRGSVGSTEGAGMPVPYVPPGHPLRPELRILSLSTHLSDNTTSHLGSGHTPTHDSHSSSQQQQSTAAGGTPQQRQQQQQQLCSGCVEVASDALSVKGYEHYLPADYHFVPSYGNEFALLSGGGGGGGAGDTSSSSKRPTPRPTSSSSSSAGSKAQPKPAAAAAGKTKQQAAASAAGAGTTKQQQQRPAVALEEPPSAADVQPTAVEDAAAVAAAAAAVDTAGAEGAAFEQHQQDGVLADEQSDSAAAEGATSPQQQQQEQQVTTPRVTTLSPTASSALTVEDSGGVAGAAAGGAGDVLEDFREFMYFIVSPKDIVIGRHRDMEDRITWCLAVGRYEAALSLAEADRTTSQELWDSVVQAYLDSLTSAGRWCEAAAILPRLLKGATAAWERWLFTFAQARQLPLLAPVLPTKDPLLPSQAYDLVLQALLVDPSHHGELLSLVSTWPHAIFHPTKLIDTIAQRLQRPGGESRELWQVLALLYKGQGRPDLSLAIYLQLQLPSVFDFIQEHGLLLYLDRNAYLLMAIDDKRALELLGAHLDTLPPGAVVPGLLDAMSACEAKGGDEGEREVWRHRLFAYLDRAFAVEPSSVSEYAELCVHLYADYCPARLMDFLQGSQTYPLEAALEVAQQRGLVDEQVYVLSRMGNSRAALRLIIRSQQDIPRAIEFVRLQRDEELWEELIDWALSSADTTGQLLDHIGGNINPLRVIQKIPEGLAIDKLRDRLRAIIADFRTQTSLREGCNAILRSDCLHLVQKLQREVKRAMPTVWLQRAHSAHGSSAAAAAAAAAGAADGGSSDVSGGNTTPGADGGGGGGGTTGAAAASKGGPSSKAAAAGASSSAVGVVSSSSGYLPQGLVGSKGPHWLRYQCGSGRAMQAANSQDVPAVAVHALAAVSSSSAVGAGAGLNPSTAAAGVGATAGGVVGLGRSAAGAAATLTSSSRSSRGAAVGGGISSSSSSGFALPLNPAQPSRVWIGRAGSSAAAAGAGDDTFSFVSELEEGAEEQGGGFVHAAAAAAAGGGASSSGAGSAAASRRSSRQQQSRHRAGSGLNLPSLVAA